MKKVTRQILNDTLLPLAVFLGLAAATWGMGQLLANAEKQRLEMETQVMAEQVKLRLEAWFDTRGAVVAQFADEWSENLEHEGASFSARANRVIQLYPGFQALNLVDRNRVIRSVVPHEPNLPALGKNLNQHPSAGVREAVDLAEQTDQVHRTPLITLLQGGPGFATYAPVRRPDGSLEGFINGVFGVDELVDGCLSETNLRDRFFFVLTAEDGRQAYAHAGEPLAAWRHRAVRQNVRIVDRDWVLDLAHSSRGLDMVNTRADELLVASGMTLSLLLALLLFISRRRQRELARNRERYRLLVENQADFIVQVDTQGRIIFLGPALCRRVGKPEAELVGGKLADLVVEQDEPLLQEFLQRMREKAESESTEFRLQTGDGSMWTAWNASRFHSDLDGEPAFVVVGRDISERRKLEHQLRQSQRLQAVGQLAGGIAHDFNNILQAIQGYLEFVMEELPPGSSSYEDLDQARQASERAAVLVRQLLAFSRRQILQPVNLNLNDVVRDMLSMLERVLGSTIALEFKPGAELGLVKADQGQIEQILMNLAVNARDAMPQGGGISIRTSMVELDEDFCELNQGGGPGRHVRLDFEDSGLGMEPEVQEKLFEPFFTTKESGSGTGLGLATVYGIIKQHEGMITVESEPGGGSCFSIFLPVRFGQVERPEEQVQLAEVLGTETVLLAEDELLLRKLAVRILESAGYHVLVAKDGAQAWEIFQTAADRIQVAVLDVVMPRLDGRSLAERLRADRPDLPVIFVSGYDSDTARGDVDPMPDTVRLSKPYNRHDLLATLRRVLDNGDHPGGSETS